MRTLSDSLGAHGGSLEYTDKTGKKVSVSALNLKMMSRYEKWLESRALQNCLELKNVDSKLFREAFQATNQSILKGDFAFGGPIAQESLQTSSGVGKLVSLMCSITEDHAMTLILEEGEAFRVVLDLAIKQSMPQKDDEEQGNVETAQQNS
jgi:hypothetical protein